MHKFEWYRENEVVQLALSGDLDMEEITEFNKVLNEQYYEKADRRLVLIVDGRDIGKIATNIPGVIKAARPVVTHPKSGRVIFIGFDAGIARFFASIVSQIIRKEFAMASGWQEVDRLLARYSLLEETRETTEVS